MNGVSGLMGTSEMKRALENEAAYSSPGSLERSSQWTHSHSPCRESRQTKA